MPPKARTKRVRRRKKTTVEALVVAVADTDITVLDQLLVTTLTPQVLRELMTEAVSVGDDVSVPTPILPGKKKTRPSKYDPQRHPQAAVKAMSLGASREELCAEMGVWPVTLRLWERTYPEFKMAIKIGTSLSRAWWMQIGRSNVQNKNFNHVLWMMNMSNRFKWSRADNPLPVTTGNTEIKSMTVNMLNLMKDDKDVSRDVTSLLGKLSNR